MAKGKVHDKAKMKDKVLEVSGGVVSYLADLLLFMVCYGMELSVAGHGSRAAGRAYARTLQGMHGVQEKSSLRGFETLKARGYIRYSKGKSDVEITAAGRERLRRVVPVYEKRRKWDKRLYLVTYDIPEDKKHVRNRFRDYLKALGCGMLQASVWITPYDPREVLRKFVCRNLLEGEVLISYAGKDSNIAGEDLEQLVQRVYHLDELNERYIDFLKKSTRSWPLYRIAAVYYSILKDDPQLPFELLPKDWKGDDAYRHFFKVVGNLRGFSNSDY